MIRLIVGTLTNWNNETGSLLAEKHYVKHINPYVFNPFVSWHQRDFKIKKKSQTSFIMNYSVANEQHSMATRCVNQIIRQKGQKSSFPEHDYSTLITFMCFVCHGSMRIKEQRLLQTHMINHWLTRQKLYLFQINSIVLFFGVWLFECLKFHDPIPMQLFLKRHQMKLFTR